MATETLTMEEERGAALTRVRNVRSVLEPGILRAAEALAAKLNREIAQGHDVIVFTIALLLAAFKDGVLDWILDFAGIGEIPVVGQLPGIFVSASLAYFLWGKGWFRKAKIRVTYYIVALFFDNLPLLNNLPLTVLEVLWAWHVVRSRAVEAEAERSDLERAVGKSLEDIEEAEEEA